MLVTTGYWLFILLTGLGKLVAVGVLLIVFIAIPLTRIQIAASLRGRDRARAVAGNMAVAACGVLGVLIMLDNIRIFLEAL